MMPKRLTLKLKPAEVGELPASVYAQASTLGPWLQGALMQHVDTDYADFLHHLSFNPYSQYCQYDKSAGVLLWHINALDGAAVEQIIVPMQNVSMVSITALKTQFEVQDTHVEACEYKALSQVIHSTKQSTRTIEFQSPTAFKSAGAYIIIPTVKLIMQNLLMHYEQVTIGDKEVDQETLNYIEQHVRITNYKLQTQYYPNVSSGSKIPAFVGKLTLSIRGSQSLAGLAQMLLSFGEYAGVGIKTSMGMGGITCSVLNVEEKE